MFPQWEALAAKDYSLHETLTSNESLLVQERQSPMNFDLVNHMYYDLI